MTTFAYRDGVLVSDTAISYSEMVCGQTIKIAQRKGYFAAACGSAAISQTFVRWFQNGMVGDPPSMENKSYQASAYIFCPDDKIISFEPSGMHWHTAPYVADGSGSKLAYGVMANGGTAVEAIEAACKHDIFTREPITILKRPEIMLPILQREKAARYDRIYANMETLNDFIKPMG